MTGRRVSPQSRPMARMAPLSPANPALDHLAERRNLLLGLAGLEVFLPAADVVQPTHQDREQRPPGMKTCSWHRPPRPRPCTRFRRATESPDACASRWRSMLIMNCQSRLASASPRSFEAVDELEHDFGAQFRAAHFVRGCRRRRTGFSRPRRSVRSARGSLPAAASSSRAWWRRAAAPAASA